MQIGGGQSAAFGGPLPCIEEASLHSMDNVSGQYLVRLISTGKGGGIYFEQQVYACNVCAYVLMYPTPSVCDAVCCRWYVGECVLSPGRHIYALN